MVWRIRLWMVTVAASAALCTTVLAATWQPAENGQRLFQNDGEILADAGWIEDGDSQGLDSFFSKEGRGDQIVSGLSVASPSFLRVTNDGERHFSIWARYGDGKYEEDLLVNTTGSYSGAAYLQPGRDYTLEISSSGSWSVEAYALETVSADSFSGTGDWVSPLFIPSTGTYDIQSDSESYVAVWGHYGTGKYDKDLLVNTVGSYSGTVDFQHDTYSFFEIICDGDWVITAHRSSL